MDTIISTFENGKGFYKNVMFYCFARPHINPAYMLYNTSEQASEMRLIAKILFVFQIRDTIPLLYNNLRRA
jgi:hypothetical protein